MFKYFKLKYGDNDEYDSTYRFSGYNPGQVAQQAFSRITKENSIEPDTECNFTITNTETGMEYLYTGVKKMLDKPVKLKSSWKRKIVSSEYHNIVSERSNKIDDNTDNLNDESSVDSNVSETSDESSMDSVDSVEYKDAIKLDDITLII